MSQNILEELRNSGIITEKDTWTIPGSHRPILTHEAIERIARHHGVYVVSYKWFKVELFDQMVMVEVTSDSGIVTPEVGEVNEKTVTTNIGRSYPHSVCWKRAYDRAVLKHLGIEAYSAEEADAFKQESAAPQRSAASTPAGTSGGAATTVGGAAATNTEAPIEPAKKSAIKSSISVLNKKGVDIDEASAVKTVAPNKSSVEELTSSEGSQVIANLNKLLSSAARGSG